MRFATLLLPFVVASAAVAQSVEDQIRAEVARYVTAINSGDAGAVAALYLNDPRISSAGDGWSYWGWQGIAQAAREMGSIRMTADSVAVFRLGDAVAFALLRMRWTLGSRSEARAGAMTLVYTRTREGWRVAHDHTSTLTAAAAALSDTGPSAPRRATTSCTITRIIDGDTIECARLGRVRLIGMDTPESNQRPFGAHASTALLALIPVGSEVQLEPDVEARDRYGRMLAYVWLGRTMVNWRMVREGWAVLLTYPPNVQYVEAFEGAERRAREEGKALWAAGGFDCRPADHRARRCD